MPVAPVLIQLSLLQARIRKFHAGAGEARWRAGEATCASSRPFAHVRRATATPFTWFWRRDSKRMVLDAWAPCGAHQWPSLSVTVACASRRKVGLRTIDDRCEAGYQLGGLSSLRTWPSSPAAAAG